MLNIISKSILERRVRGPKKVAENLIAGLKEIDYPFVINRALDATNCLWIHDDRTALKYLKDLPERVRVVIGPNLYVYPEEIPEHLDLSRVLYLQPSPVVKKLWLGRGYRKSEMAVWAAGVDTGRFKPSNEAKNGVLLYFKNRSKKDLDEVIKILEERKINHKLLCYGKYTEAEFLKAISGAKYLIWLGGPESQGLAMEEALSTNVPVLVMDEGRVEDGAALSAAPYFGENCGRKINRVSDFPAALSQMEKDWQSFEPREFILENLNLEKQAHAFLNLYQDHFHYSVDESKREKLQNGKNWRNNSFWFKNYLKIRALLK